MTQQKPASARASAPGGKEHVRIDHGGSGRPGILRQLPQISVVPVPQAVAIGKQRLLARVTPTETRVMEPFNLADEVGSGGLYVLDVAPDRSATRGATAADQVVVVSAVDPKSFERVGQCLLTLLGGAMR